MGGSERLKVRHSSILLTHHVQYLGDELRKLLFDLFRGGQVRGRVLPLLITSGVAKSTGSFREKCHYDQGSDGTTGEAKTAILPLKQPATSPYAGSS